MSEIAQRVAARHLQAATNAGKDMELAWAFADAWPKKTLFDPNLRYEIYQKVKEHAPQAYDTATRSWLVTEGAQIMKTSEASLKDDVARLWWD